MKFASLALLACLSLSTAATAQTFQGKPFLSVKGHAETKVKPDIFPLDVTITELSMDAAKSQKLVEDLAAKVLQEARALQVADADIEVGNLSISPETEWDDDKDVQVFKGNEYEREITLKFRSLDALRRFLDAMPMSQNLRLETDDFEFSGEAELTRKLRREAIADAREAAQEMASAVGKRLLDLFNVSDSRQATITAATGYSSNESSLGTVTVSAASISRGSAIILREGEITVSADAFLVYLIGD
jgi:uncharacterized protein YggE